MPLPLPPLPLLLLGTLPLVFGALPIFGGGPKKGGGACPRGCDCDRESAWCRGGAGGVPRGLPVNLAALSLIRWDIEVLPEGGFRHLPALTLLLVTSGPLGTIGDGAFAGLGTLQYLFIEDTQLGSIAATALRGLRGLLFLSLANNRLESLPRGLFQDLGTLTQLDLRGNPLLCDCHLRWLLRWLGTRPSPTPPEAGGQCGAPLPHQGTALALLSPRRLNCHRHELRPFQALPPALGAEPFALGGHAGVALAQPAAGACALLEWDQLGGQFRAPIVVNSSSPVACHPVPMGDTLLLVVAQLTGGSWVWRRSGGPGSPFVRHQALGQGHLRRPHAVTSAHLGGHLYVGVADSSKGGSSAVFRWASGAFYPHQTLRPWQRDTHLEFLELGGRPALVLCGAGRRPQVYRWEGDKGDKGGGGFVSHTDIPHAADAYAARHFRMRGGVYLCLARFLGDAKVMRWEGSMFRELQSVPARGSLVFQPLLLAGRRYVLLGHDLSPSRALRPGPSGRLDAGQELRPRPVAPRAFAPVAAGRRHFLVAASAEGVTRVYVHVSEDVGT